MNKQQTKAINDAWSAIAYLSQTTNWTDNGAWKDALRLERKQGLTTIEAKGNCVKAWLKGATAPDKPASDLYFIREGYLKALLLGVRHKVERAESDYTGPLFQDALAAARLGAQAYFEANTARFEKDLAELKAIGAKQ